MESREHSEAEQQDMAHMVPGKVGKVEKVVVVVVWDQDMAEISMQVDDNTIATRPNSRVPSNRRTCSLVEVDTILHIW